MATADGGEGLLLDTHAFLWLASGDERIGPALLERVEDPSRTLWLSVASIWELAIKKSLGKLSLRLPLAQLLASQCSAMVITVLEVRPEHALAVEELDFHHRDPFDRLLAAQALFEGLTLVSCDEVFDHYAVPRVW